MNYPLRYLTPLLRHVHVYETCLRLEVESVRRVVFFSPRRPLKMFDWCRAFLLAAGKVPVSPSTLKVHAAAIAAYHDRINGKSVGKHDLVVRFLRGARRLNPP